MKTYLFLIATLFSFCACRLKYTYPYNEKDFPDWWHQRAITVATVYETFNRPRTIFNYSYLANGEKINSRSSYGGTGIVLGSKYSVAYNPDIPWQHVLIRHEPIFEKDERTAQTIGVIGDKEEKESFKINRGAIPVFGYPVIETFATYYVDSVKYVSTQIYILNDKRYKTADIRGKKFKIQYWVDNPYRCIVFLDEPVIDY